MRLDACVVVVIPLPLQLSRLGFPFRHEAERVLLRRLRRKRFEPHHRGRADVTERMHATHTRPDHVAWFGPIDLSVERSLDLAAEEEVALLERVIVQADADTRR